MSYLDPSQWLYAPKPSIAIVYPAARGGGGDCEWRGGRNLEVSTSLANSLSLSRHNRQTT